MTRTDESWEESLRTFVRPDTVMVGIGNRLRGDDAFGPLVADRLAGKTAWGVLDAGETPENYLGRIAAFEAHRILLLDAACWGGSAGEVAFLLPDRVAGTGVSTHAVSLRLLSGLLAGRVSCSVGLLAVAPRSTSFLAPLSPEVAAALDRVCQALIRLGSGVACANG